MLKHLNIKITGQVQGVSFRYYAQEKAQKLGLTGFVYNEPDNSVYIEAEGKEENLEKFLQWCKQGPGFAKVEKVNIQDGKLKNFNDFFVKYQSSRHKH